jgi:hypothetical protein
MPIFSIINKISLVITKFSLSSKSSFLLLIWYLLSVLYTCYLDNRMFLVSGHDKVWVLDEGLLQWHAAGYDVESSASSDSIVKVSAACEAIEKVYQGQSVICSESSFPHFIWHYCSCYGDTGFFIQCQILLTTLTTGFFNFIF